jgi:hypothetical protein
MDATYANFQNLVVRVVESPSYRVVLLTAVCQDV